MHPILVELAPGEHRVCHCGESLTEPLCDGGNGPECRKARVFTVNKQGIVPICACGRTRTAPICDGTHGYEKKKPRRIPAPGG